MMEKFNRYALPSSKLWEIQKGGDSKQKEIPAENKLQN